MLKVVPPAPTCAACDASAILVAAEVRVITLQSRLQKVASALVAVAGAADDLAKNCEQPRADFVKLKELNGRGTRVIIIAIDVGVTGAIASIDELGSVVHLSDLPVTEYGKLKWITGGALLSRLYAARRIDQPARVFVEHVHAMPELSTVAANAMGRTFGSVVATVEIAQLPLELVSPQKWKRTVGVTSDKGSSLCRARVLFPTADLSLQKHHNRAEALLIAHYAQRYLMGVAAVQTSAAASVAVGELNLVGGGKAA